MSNTVVMDRNGDLFLVPYDQVQKFYDNTKLTNWSCKWKKHFESISPNGTLHSRYCGITQDKCSAEKCNHTWDRNNIVKTIDEETYNLFLEKIKQNKNTHKVLNDITGLDIIAIGNNKHLTYHIKNKRKIINWIVTTACNWRCSYCPPKFHKSVLHTTYNDITKLFSNVNLKSPTLLTITGGEPLDVPQIFDIIDQVNRSFSDAQILIETNGSSSYRKLIRIHQHSQLKITLHHENITSDYWTNLEQFLRMTPYTHNNIMLTWLSKDIDENMIEQLKEYKFVDVIGYQQPD